MKAPAVPALLLALLAAGCASADRAEVRSSLDLGPGGRAEGRTAFRGTRLPSLRLYNRGPGPVDHSVRTPSGRVLSEGPLQSLFLVYDDPACAEGEAVIVLEARGEAGASVVYAASGEGGASLEWDLSRARPSGPPPGPGGEPSPRP